MTIVSTATLISYSTFAFLFAVLCPAVCYGFGTVDMCSSICELEVAEASSCCFAPCETSCEQVCEETEPLAVCSGAYGTQHSIQCAVDCPAPVKSPATVENQRHLKDVPFTAPALLDGNRALPQNFSFHHADTSVSSQRTNIIATTVLRI